MYKININYLFYKIFYINIEINLYNIIIIDM